ncbi:tRNA-dihydrouridine synthase, partial [Patescibacteria group bacterium]|nr:tRNA-dihydrouridine synthase [Patescibacteria group bacterium]
PERAESIIRAVKKVITVPLSVKIRLGWSDPTDCLSFAPRIEAAGADLVTVHGRTKAQGYSGVSDWKMIARVKQAVQIPLLANGDIHTPEAAREAMAVTGADGILVARGALGNPWVLRQMEEMLATGRVETTITTAERQAATLDHMRLAVEHYGDRAPVLMRKHLAWYWKGIPYAQELRKALVQITSPDEMAGIYRDFSGRV